MTALGIALLLAGAALVIAEAHVPGGVLGVAGGLALMIGGVIAIAGLGGGAALAIPVGIGLGVVAGGGALYVAGKGRAAVRWGSSAAGSSRRVRSSWTARFGAPATTGRRTRTASCRPATRSWSNA